MTTTMSAITIATTAATVPKNSALAITTATAPETLRTEYTAATVATSATVAQQGHGEKHVTCASLTLRNTSSKQSRKQPKVSVNPSLVSLAHSATSQCRTAQKYVQVNFAATHTRETTMATVTTTTSLQEDKEREHDAQKRRHAAAALVVGSVVRVVRFTAFHRNNTTSAVANVNFVSSQAEDAALHVVTCIFILTLNMTLSIVTLSRKLNLGSREGARIQNDP